MQNSVVIESIDQISNFCDAMHTLTIHMHVTFSVSVSLQPFGPVQPVQKHLV